MVNKKKTQSHLKQMYEMLPQLHCEIKKPDCDKFRKAQGQALINKVKKNIDANRNDLGLSKMTFDDEGYAECVDGCIRKNIGFAKCDKDCTCNCHDEL